jgi:hypothetical protein
MTTAYWFCDTDHKLRYEDGRVANLGETHEAKGDLELCQNGMHASERLIDALAYAPGPVLYKVTLGGEIVKGDDKLCARSRTYVSGGVDISVQLRKFARMAALEVAHLWDMPPVVRQYLETGDESLRKNAVAADAAARAADADAYSYAYAYADAAARAAVRAAARAARDAARTAVRAARDADACDAAAARAAARAAAVAADAAADADAADAYAAARDMRNKQNDMLLKLLEGII